MLVLHRNEGESLVIETPSGERIEVTVSSLQKGGVRLAVDAAPRVTITRAELEAQQPPIILKILRRVENQI